jgi:hypothetical protein
MELAYKLEQTNPPVDLGQFKETSAPKLIVHHQGHLYLYTASLGEYSKSKYQDMKFQTFIPQLHFLSFNPDIKPSHSSPFG